MANTELRVISDPPLAGTVNMARDEALLERVGRGDSPPTLRFYQWVPPTISLGYFQHYADYERLPPPAGSLPVVRRLTGGGAILHDRELTYSLAIPVGHPLLAGGPNRLYELAHDALIAVLADAGRSARRGCQSDGSGPARGPFFCFARRHCLDVLVGGDKLAGSAQRRTRSAVLQHGSIILERRFDQQPAAALDGIVPLPADTLAHRFTESLGRLTGMTFVPGVWQADDLAAAALLVAKYGGDDWTRRT